MQQLRSKGHIFSDLRNECLRMDCRSNLFHSTGTGYRSQKALKHYIKSADFQKLNFRITRNRQMSHEGSDLCVLHDLGPIGCGKKFQADFGTETFHSLEDWLVYRVRQNNLTKT